MHSMYLEIFVLLTVNKNCSKIFKVSRLIHSGKEKDPTLGLEGHWYKCT